MRTISSDSSSIMTLATFLILSLLVATTNASQINMTTYTIKTLTSPDAGFADQNMRPLIINITYLHSALSTVPSGPKLVPTSAPPAPVVSASASALVAPTDFAPVHIHNDRRLQTDSPFVVVISGFCNGEMDRTYITDVPTCEEGAIFASISDTTAMTGKFGANPYGCIFLPAANDLLAVNEFWPPTASDRKPCSSSDRCICYQANMCTFTRGLKSNGSPCACGSSACSNHLGYFCILSENRCGPGPRCENTKGIVENSASCMCGTANCWNTTGTYCTSSESMCSVGPQCSNVDGSVVNTLACKCGSISCNKNEFCYVPTNKCSTSNGAFGFLWLTSGKCVSDSVAGRSDIVELSVCNVGAAAVGNSDQTSVEYQASQLAGMFFFFLGL